MAIYKPISTVTSIGNSLLSAGGSVLNRLSSDLGGMVGDAVGNGALGRLAQHGTNLALQKGSSEILRRASSAVNRLTYSADKKLNHLNDKINNLHGLGLFREMGISDNRLRNAGGLSLKDIHQIWLETDVDNLSRQNFYVVEVNDRSGVPPVERATGAKHSRFNLLCTELDFSSFESSPEAVDVGSVQLNKPTPSQRTEINLTLYDDRGGLIKSWAEMKSLAYAQSNGLYMPPVNYIFDVRVIFGTNIADDDFYKQVYTVQLSSMQHSLSRENQDLERVRLQFTQFDTCMPSFGG